MMTSLPTKTKGKVEMESKSETVVRNITEVVSEGLARQLPTAPPHRRNSRNASNVTRKTTSLQIVVSSLE